MCENLHYESVYYFKELHNQQEYYWPTIYRTGAAVVSTITSHPFPTILNNYLKMWRDESPGNGFLADSINYSL